VTGIAAASATYDANDRQSGITYDNNGNTTIASGVTYGYDFLNRLTSATGSITLKYDGDGNRVQETAGGVTTNFLVDDNNPSGVPQVVEELVGGVVQRQYTYGHALISQNQTSGVSFYGMDASHNVRFLTNTAGAITDQYTYDAFGSLISSSGTTPNSYRFAGEQNDANLGLYYLRARYYNAGVGRFWSRDSAEINPDDPRELNRYVYTADNPVNAVDPTGNLLAENIGENQQSANEAESGAATGRTAADAPTRALAKELSTEVEGDVLAPYNQAKVQIKITAGKGKWLDNQGVVHEFRGVNNYIGKGSQAFRKVADAERLQASTEGFDYLGGRTTGKEHFEELVKEHIEENLWRMPDHARVPVGVANEICHICQAMGNYSGKTLTVIVDAVRDIRIIFMEY